MGLLRKFIDRPHELLNLCLARIREMDAELKAWVEVRPQEATGDGPLRGVPFAAKDIFETRGLATEYGSLLYAGRKGENDAALVSELRRRGAVLVGKTHTTAFAWFDPAPTRNPRDLQRTPGGSSSGSAAAVAAGMVPFALGSQTQGSVLRPASFCGVTGFKPTFGLLPLDGVLPLAPSLDTAGLFTQDAVDMALLWERMGRRVDAATPPRLASPVPLDGVEPEMRRAFEASLDRLRSAGLSIAVIELPGACEEMRPAVRRVLAYEAARVHRERWRQHGRRIGAKLAELIEEGIAVAEAEYTAALAAIENARHAMAMVFRECPLIATPAATGPAPLGLEWTGDPRMNAPWTALHVPAIAIPMPVGSSGLPLGLQLTAAEGEDSALLAAAVEVERALRGAGPR